MRRSGATRRTGTTRRRGGVMRRANMIRGATRGATRRVGAMRKRNTKVWRTQCMGVNGVSSGVALLAGDLVLQC
jgi:hypothetical protein